MEEETIDKFRKRLEELHRQLMKSLRKREPAYVLDAKEMRDIFEFMEMFLFS
jgi:hypothetical protein